MHWSYYSIALSIQDIQIRTYPVQESIGLEEVHVDLVDLEFVLQLMRQQQGSTATHIYEYNKGPFQYKD